MIAPHDPTLQNREAFLLPPAWEAGGSWSFLLGTDAVGRDILSRLIYGARFSLLIGAIVIVLSLSIGVVLGLVAGFARGWVETMIMRLMDIILALPSLLLAIVIVAILGPGLLNAMISVAVTYLPQFTRLTRASVITELSKDYVVASRVAGAGTLRLMFKTVLPNCWAPLIVQATLGFSNAILDAAALGFLGLGAQPPTPGMGHHAGRRARVRAARLVGGDLPRPRHPGHRAGLQPRRRRAARRARPQAEAELSAMAAALLEIKNLSVEFRTALGPLQAVDGVDLTVDTGEVVGIVGESGSGKSVAMLAVMGLLPWTAKITADRLAFQGQPLLRPQPAAAPRR